MDSIILRRNENGLYELIAGSQRIEAVKKLGLLEIEAQILDVSEIEAAALSIESNLIRRNLKQIEEGKAIKKIMDKFDLSQKQIAERLGKSQSWVSQRLSLALEITKQVKNALEKDLISVAQAVIISQFKQIDQESFLNIILNKQKILNRKFTPEETRKEKTRFLNDTIYTIGFSGWSLDDFNSTLKKNKIKVLVDIRESTKSVYKPEFTGSFLKKRLADENIKYLDRPEFGVPLILREAGLEGFPWNCLIKWYTWRVTKRKEKNIMLDLANELKDFGRPILMCSERYPVPKGDQKHGCHRDILANLLLDTNIFKKRIDL